MDNIEKINQIKEKVGRTSIYISRIPESTKTEFMQLCKDEFEEDYGMCIKWLMDYRNGLLSSPNVELNMKIEFLAEQVVNLAQEIIKVQNNKPEIDKKDEKEIRSISGRIIRRGKNE